MFISHIIEIKQIFYLHTWTELKFTGQKFCHLLLPAIVVIGGRGDEGVGVLVQHFRLH